MINTFWDYVKSLHGVNGWFQERMFFKDVSKRRRLCEESDDPFYATEECYFFDKQYFLEKWWDKLQFWEKKELLTQVWNSVIINVVYDLDWWLPYFEEVGFISNVGASRPDDNVVLYRAAEEEFKKYMSWTDDLETAKNIRDIKPPITSEVRIYKTIVKPESVLGIFEGNFLSSDEGGLEYGFKAVEYIVNHNELSEIKEVIC